VLRNGKRFLVLRWMEFHKFADFSVILPERTETLLGEVNGMEEYLCLTELLDQDLSAYEFFQTLAPMLQDRLRQEDQIRSFAELQARAAEG
jgi:hypothetical protein